MLSWGDVKETYIQIAPLVLLSPSFPLDKIGPLLNKAILNPNVSLANLAASTLKGTEKLDLAKEAIAAPKIELAELVNTYNLAKVKIEPGAYGLKLLHEAVYTKDAQVARLNADIFLNAKLDWAAALKKFLVLKGNTTYEELYCVGADYHEKKPW